MVGAYGGLAMSTYLLPAVVAQQWYLALPLLLVGGAAVSAAAAVAMERFAYRPLRDAPRLAPLITALGVSVALQEAVRVFYPGAVSPLRTDIAVSATNPVWNGCIGLLETCSSPATSF